MKNGWKMCKTGKCRRGWHFMEHQEETLLQHKSHTSSFNSNELMQEMPRCSLLNFPFFEKVENFSSYSSLIWYPVSYTLKVSLNLLSHPTKYTSTIRREKRKMNYLARREIKEIFLMTFLSHLNHLSDVHQKFFLLVSFGLFYFFFVCLPISENFYLRVWPFALIPESIFICKILKCVVYIVLENLKV